MKPLVLGIDPGLGGALALYNHTTKTLADVIDTPIATVKEKGKRILDAPKLALWLDSYAPRIECAVIEEVGARPGNGVTGMFNFGYVAGAVLGLVAAHYIPYFMVKPAVWKILLGLSHDKHLSRVRAQAEFPASAQAFDRAKDDGRAEAALLAKFGADRFLGVKP